MATSSSGRATVGLNAHPCSSGVGGEDLGHHAAGSPGLHAGHGSLTQRSFKGWKMFKFGLCLLHGNLSF